MIRLSTWLISAACLAPLGLLLLLSVSAQWRYPALWPSAFDAGLWSAIVEGAQRPLWQTLRDSLLLSGSVALVASACGLATSEVLSRLAASRRWLGLAVLPFAISPVILALSLGQGFLRAGLAGSLLGVAAAQWLFAYPYASLLTHALWSRQTRRLEQLALSLGASRRQILARVWWPLGRGLLAVCLFQTFLMSWFDFALVRLIGGGQVMTLSLRVYEFFRAGDIRLAAISGLLMLTPPLLVALLRPRWLLWPVDRRERA